MKKLFYVLPGLCLFASGAAAETIDSVSFNPARLGRYETLKVSDQLTTKGGIEANAVTVQSGGTVSVNNAGNYKFPATEVKGSVEMTSTEEVKGSVEMTSTDFKADTLNSRGTASFENKSSSAESKISTLNTSTADVRANILDLTSVTVPTGGSFTLGENAIPEPGQECSNLRWVERTTDDNYKYKVLAFGACAGGGDDCKESYGSWITFTGSKTDTCNGRTSAMYICSGTEKSCVDVYITSSGSSGNKYGTPTTVAYGTAKTADTCDGDYENLFTGTPSGSSCVDVYMDSSSIWEVINNPNSSTHIYQANCMDHSPVMNDVSSPYDEAVKDTRGYCLLHYPDSANGCSVNLSKKSSQNYPGSGSMMHGNSGNGMGTVTGSLGGGSFGGENAQLNCKIIFKKRTVTKGSATESKKYRNVTCCDGGGLASGGTLVSGGSQVAVGGGTGVSAVERVDISDITAKQTI